MKKIALVALSLLTTASLAQAASIYGPNSIHNTKHDLSNLNASVPIRANNAANGTTQVCVFCHTPHGAFKGNVTGTLTDANVKGDLLWNRSGKYTKNFTFYSSSTKKHARVSSFQAQSKSLYCLTCHDGTVAQLGSNVHNLPADNVGGTIVMNPGQTTWTKASMLIGGDSYSLTNDHPVGFPYNSTLITASNGALKSLNTAPLMNWVPGNANMECGSCHSVHTNQYTKFLRTTNSGSYICFICHNK